MSNSEKLALMMDYKDYKTPFTSTESFIDAVAYGKSCDADTMSILAERDTLRADKHKAINLMQSWMALYDDAKSAYTKYKIERDALKSELEVSHKQTEKWIGKAYDLGKELKQISDENKKMRDVLKMISEYSVPDGQDDQGHIFFINSRASEALKGKSHE